MFVNGDDAGISEVRKYDFVDSDFDWRLTELLLDLTAQFVDLSLDSVRACYLVVFHGLDGDSDLF